MGKGKDIKIKIPLMGVWGIYFVSQVFYIWADYIKQALNSQKDVSSTLVLN